MAATTARRNVTVLGLFVTVILFYGLVLFGGVGTFSVGASHLFQPLIEVWSETYKSNNITDLSLTSGEFTVKINVTETPTINTYGFILRYNPSYINATKVIIKEGTFFGDACFYCLNQTGPPLAAGVVEVQVSVTGANVRAGSGVLAFITFRVLGIGATSLDIDDDELFYGGEYILHATQDGLFRNSLARPPEARFTYSPTAPFQGNISTFDASSSSDPDEPDGRIVSYFWRWGDDTGTSTTATPVTTHVFRDRNGDPTYGDFTVTLTVTDDTGLTDSVSASISVTRLPFHDVLIGDLDSNLLTANPGQIVTLTVLAVNAGTFDETTRLEIRVGTTTIDTRESISLDSGRSQPFEIRWDTTGYSPSVYRVTANVTVVSGETNVDNNSYSIFVNIAAPSTGLAAPLIVGSGIGVTAIIALFVYLFRRRRARAEP